VCFGAVLRFARDEQLLKNIASIADASWIALSQLWHQQITIGHRSP
jgi:hypothetical protein